MASIRHLLGDKTKEIAAYIGLGLLFGGWVAFVLTFVQIHVPEEVATNAGTGPTIEVQRARAIENAKRQGKREYSFTTSRLPVPLSQ